MVAYLYKISKAGEYLAVCRMLKNECKGRKWSWWWFVEIFCEPRVEYHGLYNLSEVTQGNQGRGTKN